MSSGTGPEQGSPEQDGARERVLAAFGRFFEVDDWPAQPVPGQALLRVDYEGRTTRWPCYARGVDPEGLAIFYSLDPVPVPAARRPAIAELLTRINYHLPVGNLEMDHEDGEVRMRTSLVLGDAELTVDLLRALVGANVMLMDRYLPAIIAVATGNAEPEAAFRAAASASV
ncbi:MAG: YbjN domain-containing protein [Acidimicrobiales bacterium]